MAPPLPRQAFLDAMSRVGAAVHVVTTDGPAGRHGFTATSVCSVAADPPTLLVCRNRAGEAADAFLANGVLCVNTLAAAQQALAPRFAGEPAAGRFGAGTWGRLVTGAPVLAGALAAFDCRIVRTVEVASHWVLFAEVAAVAGEGEGDDPLLYFGRGYRRLVAE